MNIQTPDWVKNAVFYQIFPDRFARSQRIKHPRGIRFKPWGSPPEEQGYQGGDLLGVVDKLDYLQELGIIHNQRGIGYFVSPGATERTRQFKRDEFVTEELPRVFKTMTLIGMDLPSLGEHWERYLESNNGGK